MTYKEKVEASKPLLNALEALKDGESVKVEYGFDYDNRPRRYQIRCSIFEHSGRSYSIYKDEAWSFNGMNFDSFTKTIGKAFTYDLMSQRTGYNFPLYEMKIVNETTNAE